MKFKDTITGIIIAIFFLLMILFGIYGCTINNYPEAPAPAEDTGDMDIMLTGKDRLELSTTEYLYLCYICEKYNIDAILYKQSTAQYTITPSTKLSPPSLKEAEQEEEFTISINFADNYGDMVTIESHKNNIENVFKYAEQYMRAFKIYPKMIFYFVEPQDLRTNIKAYQLTEQLMKSL